MALAHRHALRVGGDRGPLVAELELDRVVAVDRSTEVIRVGGEAGLIGELQQAVERDGRRFAVRLRPLGCDHEV